MQAGMDTDKTLPEIPHAELTDKIIGAFYDVANELGHGFSEEVLTRALVVVMKERGLRVDAEVQLPVKFHGQVIGVFKADLVVAGKVLIEVKVGTELQPYAHVQLMNYLKAAGGGLGLLLHFGRRAEVKRKIVGDAANSLPLLGSAEATLATATEDSENCVEQTGRSV
jgi:GxxExxY protein